MKYLILASHGSRLQSSNDEVRALTEKMALQSSEFKKICPAFLELESPDIQEAIEQAVTEGATDIVIVPHFLAAGMHVTKDIPEAIKQARQTLPDIQITLSAYLGEAKELPGILLNIARQT